ncbi:MAG: hypothetical protein B7X74_04680, partial [Thiotrichales bacterium 39-47-5]
KGCHNVDHRLHQQDFAADAAGVMPYLAMPIEQVEKVKAALLIGSNLRHEQPLLNQRLRKATQMRAKVMAINPVDFDLSYRLSVKATVSVSDMVTTLASLAKALSANQSLSNRESSLLEGVVVTDITQKMADQLSVEGDKLIILGQLAQSHVSFTRLLQLASLVARLSGAQLSWLPESGNSLGAALVGAQPKQSGMNAAEMLRKGMDNWLLWNVDPTADCLLPEATQLTGRVVAVSAFDTPGLRAVSDWLLPIAAFGEAAGSYVNANGLWQFAPVALTAVGDAKPGWKVLRVLGNMMNVSGFDYVSLDQVTEAAKAMAILAKVVDHDALMNLTSQLDSASGFARVAELPMYANDIYVRHAQPLQAHQHAGQAVLRMNPQEVTDAVVRVQDVNGNLLELNVVADARVAAGNIVAPMSLLASLPADFLSLAA